MCLIMALLPHRSEDVVAAIGDEGNVIYIDDLSILLILTRIIRYDIIFVRFIYKKRRKI